MDDRELDNILDELKNRTDDGLSPEDSLPAAAKAQQAEETPEAEKAPAEEAPEEIPEEAPVEEEPEAEAISEDAEEIPEEIEEPAEIEKAPAEEIPEEPAEEPEEEVEEAAEPEEEPEETEEEPEGETDLLALAEEGEEPEESEGKLTDKQKKAIIGAGIAALILAIAVASYFIFFYKPAPEPEPTTVTTTEATTVETVKIVNPLTGEAGYNEKAMGKRPVAVVVENEYGVSSVRPQWGIDKADVIVEAETEYSTRMIFLFADYTNMPEKIGSARSARPPFIRFSQLFDCIFIHAGLSNSKGNYVGADAVFKSDNVDHINLLNEGKTYFDRDYSRTSMLEHTGFLKGKNTEALIKSHKLRTKLNEKRFTQFVFNDEVSDMGTKKAQTVTYKWSNRAQKKANFVYDSKKGKYVTTDFDSQFGESKVEFETLLLLFDTTEYIVKENYKGNKSETYCNYLLDGGKGAVVSNGTYTEIKWSVKNGKIVMKDSDGKTVKLNPGKIYIAYGSTNNGGEFSIEGAKEESTN